MFKQRMLITYDPTVRGHLTVSRVYNVSYNDAVAHAKTKTVTLAEGDKVFYLPDNSIPRFKTKALSDSHGFKSVRNIDDADYIFIGPPSKGTSLKSLSTKQVKYESYYIIPDVFSSRLFQYVMDPTSIVFSAAVKDVMWANKDMEFIISEDDSNQYRDYIKSELSVYIWFKYDHYRKNFISLPNPSLYSKLRSEDHLTSLISGESIVITDQKFEELQRMFDSNIQENVILAMEIMANSNYEESILNNYMLLNKNAWQIRRLRESNHKNFRSLINFYNTEISYLGGNFSSKKLETLTEVLKNHGKFTRNAMNRMIEKYDNDNYTFKGAYYNCQIRPNEDLEYDE